MTSNAQTIASVDAAIPADLDGYDPEGLLTAEETQRGIDKWRELAKDVAAELYPEAEFSSHTQTSDLNRGEATTITPAADEDGYAMPDEEAAEEFYQLVSDRWEAWMASGALDGEPVAGPMAPDA